jgi:hypothetical protein
MTKKELIEQIKDYPDDIEILISEIDNSNDIAYDINYILQSKVKPADFTIIGDRPYEIDEYGTTNSLILFINTGC